MWILPLPLASKGAGNSSALRARSAVTGSTKMRFAWHLRGGRLLLLLISVGCSRGAGPHSADATALIGRWIQVYPAEGALDTLILREDGTVRGSVSGFDPSGAHDITHWNIGTRLMPGGFCIGEGAGKDKFSYCQGFLIEGDTLWFANRRRSVFVRIPADGRRVDFAAWDDPHRSVFAPEPAESVRAVSK